MGVYLKNTMPLLSTLAALVIIVNSAEEDLDEYARELRPRTMETDTTNYDGPWRAVKIEPMMTHSTQTDTWDGSLEDPPKRRRPIRKRRRRPQAALRGPQERYLQPGEYRPYNTDNYRPLTETPYRRRKKIDAKQDDWNVRTEAAESPRPFRRKGPKRTSDQESWHEFSEFGDVPGDENLDNNAASPKHETTNYDAEVENSESHQPRLTINQFYNEEKNRNAFATVDVTAEDDDDEPLQFPANKDEYEEQNNPEVKENKSLSEFSLENGSPIRISRNRNENGTPGQENLNDITEQSKPLDPISLKDILQKSKGKSLSELLQQHNLTLADLLSGEKNALSVLKTTELPQTEKETIIELSTTTIAPTTKTSRPFTGKTHSVFEHALDVKKDINLDELSSSEEIVATTFRQSTTESTTTVVTAKTSNTLNKFRLQHSLSNETFNIPLNETFISGKRRRYPTGVRINLRMRPLGNNSYKGQLSRDMINITNRRYQNKNFTKFRQWKELIPAIKNITHTKFNISFEDIDKVTTTLMPEEITTTENMAQFNTINTQSSDEAEMETTNTNTDTIPTTTDNIIETTTYEVIPPVRPSLASRVRTRQNITNLRQQAFVNRLRNIKSKHKIATNKTSPEHLLSELFEMANLVSASEFIAKMKPKPNNTSDVSIDTVTMVDDLTDTSTKSPVQKSIKRSRPREKKLKPSTTAAPIVSTTEKAAKFEIEEILHDSLSSATLSKILRERNMTLSELLEHRERGSSHVHLADIFHNASREPNPPEPFLSKSLIEPISKETYPLRALLEANSHNSTAKPTTAVPYVTQTEYISIPMMMDFGNNVNENGENVGISSLINNFTVETNTHNPTNIMKNVKNEDKIAAILTNRTSRQSRGNEDLITLNEIFSLIQRSRNMSDDMVEHSSNDTSDLTVKKIVLEEDINGDGLIVLEDVQGLDHNPSDEKVEFKSLESDENSPKIVPETVNHNTRSATVVTASIVGLIAVLFLLTFVTFRWKHQQHVFIRKYGSSEDRIPSPVFENRMTTKSSSMRSLSPMLSSNIYSIDTLEKPHDKDCPEYTWDSLRKPYL
ncbi:PREDICTED: uncharacterized protein LOC106121761 [Papilio xuthus]|uniref:Uncharacterized protein LOC106121761 n=1 Tax=Papilio xuthus TaxID=66420 RepID=A0AAJ6ZI71_PAPXU|nr:PREDICTED: uncharacterized protein LOC106121761 [Papilio xuthus]